MKKKLSLIIIFLLLLVGGVSIYIYINTFHAANFLFEQTDISIDIYQTDGDKIKTLSNNGMIKLQNGEYYYLVDNDKYDTDIKQMFTIKDKDETVTVNPNYSNKYLVSLLNKEKSKIEEIINSKYGTLMNDYTLSNSQLFKHGEWCGVILIKNVSPRYIDDNYRLILHKIENEWLIINKPEIILTKYNQPDVPIEILRAVNNIADF